MQVITYLDLDRTDSTYLAFTYQNILMHAASCVSQSESFALVSCAAV